MTVVQPASGWPKENFWGAGLVCADTVSAAAREAQEGEPGRSPAGDDGFHERAFFMGIVWLRVGCVFEAYLYRPDFAI